MNQPAASRTSEQTPVTTSTTASPATRDQLATGEGQISVADGVVQKIAGKACREIPGVHAMGTGGAPPPVDKSKPVGGGTAVQSIG